LVTNRLCQADIHAKWGGIVPKLAQEAHQEAINRVVDDALQQANLSPSEVDAVAVTIGPGLSLCLQVGIDTCALCRRRSSVSGKQTTHLALYFAAAEQGQSKGNS
jgi:tRNA A37 threonylcarbamoyltransferase TsaD